MDQPRLPPTAEEVSLDHAEGTQCHSGLSAAASMGTFRTSRGSGLCMATRNAVAEALWLEEAAPAVIRGTRGCVWVRKVSAVGAVVPGGPAGFCRGGPVSPTLILLAARADTGQPTKLRLLTRSATERLLPPKWRRRSHCRRPRTTRRIVAEHLSALRKVASIAELAIVRRIQSDQYAGSRRLLSEKCFPHSAIEVRATLPRPHTPARGRV